MATTTCELSEHQFRCSICLEVFTEPTSLPCGHNFCKGCIERTWLDTVVYKCPCCKHLFITKPELKVNTFITELSAHFKQSVKRQESRRYEGSKWHEDSKRHEDSWSQEDSWRQKDGWRLEDGMKHKDSWRHENTLKHKDSWRHENTLKHKDSWRHENTLKHKDSWRHENTLKHKDSWRHEQQNQVAKPGEISCDVCTEPKMKALKSCLVCLMSYCSTHLQPHRTVLVMKRHELTEPQRDLEDKVCPEHAKVLELYCQDEEMCICVMCASDHKYHQVVSLREGSEQKQQQLARTHADLENMIKTRQMKILELRRTVESTDSDADLTEGLRVFTALKEAVDRALDNLLHEISVRQAATKSQAEAAIQELEREIQELSRQLSEVQQLSQSKDHLQILQNFKLKRSPSRIKDWSSVKVSALTSEGTVGIAVSKLEEEFTKITKEVLEGELRRVKKSETLVTLDEETAHPQLVVSQNGAQISYSIEQRNVPNTVSRFEDFFVLGKQSFSQNFYFEAEVKGKMEWTLGVAKKTVNRKGRLKLDPQNGVWTISLKGNNYLACADREVPLTLKAKLETVGVFVDYGQGRVSFYDVENATLIYSFSGFNFSESLHPICSPGRHFHGNFSPLVICQTAIARRMTWPAMKWPTLG